MTDYESLRAERAALFQLETRANALRVQLGTWQRARRRRDDDPEPRLDDAIAMITAAIAHGDRELLAQIVAVAARWHHDTVSYLDPRDEDALLDRLLAL